MHGAHTNIQGRDPQLFCTRHGKWIYNEQSANLCFCKANYISENDACIERGKKNFQLKQIYNKKLNCFDDFSSYRAMLCRISYYCNCTFSGPVCYVCSGSNETDCDDSSAVFCDKKQYCFTRITKALKGNVIRKGCINKCTANRIMCKTREEPCEMCCQEDYCNSRRNMSKVDSEYLRPYPMFRVVCPRNITVLRFAFFRTQNCKNNIS